MESRCVIAGNGSIDIIPLKAQVQATAPKANPKIACQRFCPVYGKLDGPVRVRYRLKGEYLQIPITMPSKATTVPNPEDQMTTLLHSAAFLRRGVK